MTLFKGQALHLVALAALLTGVIVAARAGGNVLAGSWWGLSTTAWLAIAVATPIVHQVYVWLVWRLELTRGAVSGALGRERGFRLYQAGFSILFVGRLLTIIGLGVANRNTLPLSPSLAYGLAAVLLLPALYLFYSVARYFGIERAYGIDHFDPAYRGKPFVKQGIFRFTSNGMYTFGFLALWVPGLLLLSQAALLAAAFNHLYIWVHYYATELPDIHYLYGRQ
jgi:hypothetical protein